MAEPRKRRPTDAEIGAQESAMFARAGMIAEAALGRDPDPLEYWTFIDLVVSFAARHGATAKRMVDHG